VLAVKDATEVDDELVRGLGADVVVRREDDIAARVRQKLPRGGGGLADGSLQGALVLPAVKDGGMVTTVRGYPRCCSGSAPEPPRESSGPCVAWPAKRIPSSATCRVTRGSPSKWPVPSHACG
jgi:hypothetical protein